MLSELITETDHYIVGLYDFHIVSSIHLNDNDSDGDGDGDGEDENEDEMTEKFVVQLFGRDEQRRDYSVLVRGFFPFFFVLVGDHWTDNQRIEFEAHLRTVLPKRLAKALLRTKLVEAEKLYGFSNHYKYKFVCLEFRNIAAFNMTRNLWYDKVKKEGAVGVTGAADTEKKLRKQGYEYKKEWLKIYESNIPPIFRFFHMKQLLATKWMAVPKGECMFVHKSVMASNADVHISCPYRALISMTSKETIIPLNIMSYDIEADSSHGDFPLPTKTHKKLASELIKFFDDIKERLTNHEAEQLLCACLKWAFLSELPDVVNEHTKNIQYIISKVYTKPKPALSKSKKTVTATATLITAAEVDRLIEKTLAWVKSDSPSKRRQLSHAQTTTSLEGFFKQYDKSAAAKKGYVDPMLMQDVLDCGDRGAGGGAGEGDGDDGVGEGDGEGDGDDENIEDNEDGEEAEEDGAQEEVEAQDEADIRPRRDIFVHLLQNKKLSHDERVCWLDDLFTVDLRYPSVEGDKVICIGSTFQVYGQKSPYYEYASVLKDCATVPGNNVHVEWFGTEKEVLLAWTRMLQRMKPDIAIGYNITGFDDIFMTLRAKECGCIDTFLKMSRNTSTVCGTYNQKTDTWDIKTSNIVLASGSYDLKYIEIPGCVKIDLQSYYRRNLNTDSYKLDDISGLLLGDLVNKNKNNNTWEIVVDAAASTTTIHTKNTSGILPGTFVRFEEIRNSVTRYNNGHKYQVTEVDEKGKWFRLAGQTNMNADLAAASAASESAPIKDFRWCLAKDDVDHTDIFRLFRGNAKDRAVLTKYCLQDCNLLHHLMSKSQILTGLIEMSNVTMVPLSFTVFRGQGVNLLSLLSAFCLQEGVKIPVIDSKEDTGSFDGAVVLDPKIGIHTDAINCNDFASLYPSSMMSENLSPDSKVFTKDYDLAGNLVAFTLPEGITDTRYDHLPGHTYVDTEFAIYEWRRIRLKNGALSKNAVKILKGHRVCRFAQFPNGKKAIFPKILDYLVSRRNATKEAIPLQTEAFMKVVLEARQNVLKVRANSLYGGSGAPSSPFCEKDVAASTTAIGRKNLLYALKFVTTIYADRECKTSHPDYPTVRTHAREIYGDTDSVFYTLGLPDTMFKRDRLLVSMELGEEVGFYASMFMKAPHKWAFEKTMYPLCMLSKKRYTGLLYDKSPDECKRKDMGVALKRRDYAPIVKTIFGEIVDIILYEMDILKSLAFFHQSMQTLAEGAWPGEAAFLITKQLRSYYPKPEQIAHRVLADRITARDPGNRPQPGDRIKFMFVTVKEPTVKSKKKKGGDRIETPEFIAANHLKIDYQYYIEHQIMAPVAQWYATILEQMWGYCYPKSAKKQAQLQAAYNTALAKLQKTCGIGSNGTNPNGTDDKEFAKKKDKLRSKCIQSLLFQRYINEAQTRQTGMQKITLFFGKKT